MKISVITINYNNSSGLKKTMESVFAQTSKEFEHIIVDGASIDNSVQTIQRFNSRYLSGSTIQQFQYISEPDKGIYNAMNKGIKMSSGDFLLFLNSGDIFYDELVLEKCAEKIDENVDICSGILILEKNGKSVTLNPPATLSLYQSIYNHLTHPNTFIKRSLFDKYGLYNENNKIVSDWEFFFLASGVNECTYRVINIPIAVFFEDGISSSNIELQDDEKNSIIKKHLTQSVINELIQRNQLEKMYNEPQYVYISRLSNKPFARKIILLILKVLNKIIR